MKISTGLLATLGALAMATGAGAGTSILTDGNFNAPYAGGNFVDDASGTTFGGWTVGTPSQDPAGGGSVDLIGGYWQAPPATGGGSVDLDGLAAGSISQTVDVTAPGTYDLTFYFSGNPDGGAAAKSFDVTLAGYSGAFTYTTGSNTHGNMNYTYSGVIPVYLGDGLQTLTFSSTDSASSDWGAVIGGVGLALPEPGTWGLMLVGLGGLGAALRARRKLAIA